MNIKQLLARLQELPSLDQKSNTWPFVEAVSTLYSELLGQEPSRGLENLEGFSNIGLHVAFDFLHQSDESCYVQVVSYGSTPFALVHKFGDKYSAEFTVLNRDVYLDVGKMVAAYQLEESLKRHETSLSEQEATDVTDLSELSNQYMTWVSDELGLFSVNSPRWMYGFVAMADTYAAVMQQDDGTFHRVERIVGFTGPRNGSSDTRVDILTDEGETHVVRGEELMFFLLRPATPVDAARGAVALKTEWAYENKVTALGQWIIRCVQYREGRIRSERISSHVTGGSTKVDAFVASYGADRHEGEFIASDYGLEAI